MEANFWKWRKRRLYHTGQSMNPAAGTAGKTGCFSMEIGGKIKISGSGKLQTACLSEADEKPSCGVPPTATQYPRQWHFSDRRERSAVYVKA